MISVESTIVPFCSSKSQFRSFCTTCSRNRSPIWFFSRIWRKRLMVYPSGTWLLESTPAELRECLAVDNLVHNSGVRQIIQLLQDVDPEHQFQVVWLTAALSFVVVRLYNRYPFRPGDHLGHDGQKLFFFVLACTRSSLNALSVICLFTL